MKPYGAASVTMAITAAIALLGMPSFSTAAFTSTSSNPGSTVVAAADWTPPTVTLQSPGATVSGTVIIAATASDAESAIASVVFQRQAVGSSTWTTLCTVTAAPYSCAWNTLAAADGQYDLRAIATDAAGYSATSALVRATVANTVVVTLSNPGADIRGSVPLTTTISNEGAAAYTVRVEYSVAAANSWTSICTDLSSPYACTWATTAVANGYYDLRSVAVSGSVTATSAVVVDVFVDNTVPVVALTDPGTPLSGFRTFSATATDADSGVASVQVQWAPSGSTTFTTLCTILTPPYSCSYNTALLPDGTYSFRAIADDDAGNRGVSATFADRVIDNTISSVSVVDPGEYIRGTVTLEANAASTAGVVSIAIQRAPAGTTTWTTVCTITAQPYGCAWNSATVADGLYDFRGVLVDGANKTTISATIANRRVDNTPLRGYDVQAVNGAGAVGKIDNGDVITFTYNRPVALTTVSPGWSGSALAVTLRVQDGGLFGLGASGDSFDILRTGSQVNLGRVSLKGDYIKSNKTAQLNATMVASSATVNGTVVTVITITVGTASSNGPQLRAATTAAAMVWAVSDLVTDAQGNKASLAPVTELGTVDGDF